MKKKIIIGILIAAIVSGSVAGGSVYYKKSHQKTVSVVSVESIADSYYGDDTNLSGNITASAVQNVTLDKDMIIDEVYVSQGDTVSAGDKLITFDMTLVQMEVEIAKLKQEQLEQKLAKAKSRLSSLQNGGAVQESDGETESSSISSDTNSDSSSSNTDSDSSTNNTASAADSNSNMYLATAINPVLVAMADSGDTSDTGDSQESEDLDVTDPDTGTDTDDSSKDSGTDTNDTTDEISSDDLSGEEIEVDNDYSDVEIDSDAADTENSDLDLDSAEPTFYQVLDENTKPYTGSGTKDDPYVFLCSSAKGYVIAKGSFLNKMAAFNSDGTKESGKTGYWYQLEFHQNDTISSLVNRKESCTGYYLVDGSELEKMVPDDSEIEYSLDGASQYESESDYDDAEGGDDGSEVTTISRDDAIKTQKSNIKNLELDINQNKLNIEKLEKKLKKETIYSKLDGTIEKMGDPTTGTYDGNYFMTIKSKDGFYVQGTVSELMLDQLKEGTTINCSTQTESFEATVIDVSDYPVSSDSSYDSSGNPNASYYTYTATIDDKSVQVSDSDWLTVSLQTAVDSDAIPLIKAFVITENGKSYVYKDDNGVLKKQAIEVDGNVNSGYDVLVTGGLSRDDLIALPYGDNVVEGATTKEVSSSDIYGY